MLEVLNRKIYKEEVHASVNREANMTIPTKTAQKMTMCFVS